MRVKKDALALLLWCMSTSASGFVGVRHFTRLTYTNTSTSQLEFEDAVFNGSTVATRNGAAYLLTVVATDDGKGEMSGQNFSTVIVGDVNEMPTLAAVIFHVDENEPAGAVVGDVGWGDLIEVDAALVLAHLDLEAPAGRVSWALR